MDIGECMDRLEGYGYTVKGRMSDRLLIFDGHGLRVGVTVAEGTVAGIDCFMTEDGVDILLGTTVVYPVSSIRRRWVDGLGLNEMLSVLSEPGKAVMRFGAMKVEEELGVLEG